MKPSPATFTASLWLELQREWLWVYAGCSPRVNTWSREITVPAGVFFVEAGEVRIQTEGREIRVVGGQCFFTAPGTRRQWFAPGTRLLSVGLRCHWADGRPLHASGLNCVFPARKTAALQRETRLLYRAVHGRKKEVTYPQATVSAGLSVAGWAARDAAFARWFHAYVQTLESLDCPATGPRPETAGLDAATEKLVAWLLNWPVSHSPDLSEAAKLVGLTPRRVHDKFTLALGMSAQAWLERKRLDVARRRLVQEDTPLKEIAFALGFRHAPHFTTWFRRLVGVAPSAYRQGHGMDAA